MSLRLAHQYKEILGSGGVVAVPTETVYGLAASIFSDDAIRSVFSLKNRPSDNPLIVHIASRSQIEDVACKLSPLEELLCDAFWPGPLTLILKAKSTVSPLITAGQKTVAVRMPNHPLTLQLIGESGPLVAPSANLSTYPSATRAEHVKSDFGNDFPVLNGGPCETGIESTIVSVSNGEIIILREGAISATDLQQYATVSSTRVHTKQTPGSRYLHYAPSTPIEMMFDRGTFHPVVIGYEDRSYACTHLFSLGYSTDARSIRKALYSTLRALDSQMFSSAYIDADLPDTPAFSAIHNRMRKLTGRTRESACISRG